MGAVCGSSEKRPKDAPLPLHGVRERTSSGSCSPGCSVRHWGGLRRGYKRDEDRWSVCTSLHGMPDSAVAAVLDGHGVRGASWGADVAERGAEQLPALFVREYKGVQREHASDHSGPGVDSDGATRDSGWMVGEALKRSFAAFQRSHEDHYDHAVMKEVEQKRAEFEAATQTVAPEFFPPEGGSTATAVAVSGDTVAIGWVGDSRAVMACDDPEAPTPTADDAPETQRADRRDRGDRDSSGEPRQLSARDLTIDHSVEENEQERERVLSCGGSIVGPYLSHPSVEGLLQVTRSLGDAGYHRNGVVSAVPETLIVSRRGPPKRFIVVASDGVWKVVTSSEAVNQVHASLSASNYYSRPADDSPAAASAVLRACENLEAFAMTRAKEKGAIDDISVVILTFKAPGTTATGVPPQVHDTASSSERL